MVCSGGEETTLHHIKDCSFSQQAWALSGIPYDGWGGNVASMEEWKHKLHDKLSRVESEFAATLIWGIWYRRN